MIEAYASLFIPGPLPGTNEILAARGKVARAREGSHKRGDGYNDLKREWTTVVQALAMQARLRPRCIPAAHFTFMHFELDQRRDPDNFCGGAQKILLDALKCAELIENDGWRHVLGLQHYWTCRQAENGRQMVGVHLFATPEPISRDAAYDHARPVWRAIELIQRSGPKREARAPRPKRSPAFAG